MSYIELSSVLFRGRLEGASGDAGFKLTAQAIDVVDTLHIAGGEVTSSSFFSAGRVTAAKNSAIISGVIEIFDDEAWVEVVAYADNGSEVHVDGVKRVQRNKRGPGSSLLCFVEMILLARGIHSVSVIATSAVTSAKSHILCRYIRNTGASNVAT